MNGVETISFDWNQHGRFLVTLEGSLSAPPLRLADRNKR